MKTVTLIAHSRPGYTAQAIGALAEALLKPDEPIFDKLIISIDPGNAEVETICNRMAEVLSTSGVIDCTVYVNAPRQSPSPTDAVAENELLALSRAFEEHGSEFNLSIEDDAILTPDAALLAKWFWECHGGPASKYTLMAMCNHRDFGHGENPGGVPNDPSYVAEASHIAAPFAWCMSKWQWPFVRDYWNKKVVNPSGWDWSLSYAMRLDKRRTLHPVLSRCKNIGREGGVHEYPEWFDKSQGGLVYSDGMYAGPYKIVVKIPDSELEKLEPWMLPEVANERSKTMFGGLPDLGRVKTLVDVGAGDGGFLLPALNFYKPEKWLAIEMLPERADRLCEIAAASNGAGSVACVAVGDEFGPIPAHVTPHIDSSSLLEINPESEKMYGYSAGRMTPNRKVAVSMSMLDSLCIDLGEIDLVKVDVQGYEGRLIAGGQQTLARTRAVIIEELFVQHYFGQATPEEIEHALNALGFKLVRWLEKNYNKEGILLQGDALYVRE